MKRKIFFIILFVFTLALAISSCWHGNPNYEDESIVPIPDMAEIRAGTFDMGDSLGGGDPDEKPVHEVRITYDYEIARYELTNTEFLRFLNDAKVTSEGQLNGKKLINMDSPYCDFEYVNDTFKLKHKAKANYPVHNVTWWAGIEYCNWLSNQHGYFNTYNENGLLLNEYMVPTYYVSAVVGYRLLTEAEWEYAARGAIDSANTGTDYKYAGCNDASIDDHVWYYDNSTNTEYPIDEGRGVQEVGQKKPNGIGIYDMSGNVSEWCQDGYSEDFYADPNSKKSDPWNPVHGIGYSRIIRGGSWRNAPYGCRVTIRDHYGQNENSNNIGIRIARTLHQ